MRPSHRGSSPCRRGRAEERLEVFRRELNQDLAGFEVLEDEPILGAVFAIRYAYPGRRLVGSHLLGPETTIAGSPVLQIDQCQAALGLVEAQLVAVARNAEVRNVLLTIIELRRSTDAE